MFPQAAAFGNSELLMMQDQLNKMMLQPGLAKRGVSEMAMPRMDVYKRVEDGAMVVWVELPGVKKNEVEVNVIDEKLVISGRKRYHGSQSPEEDEDKMVCLRTERDWGMFVREIRVPRGLEEHQVKAEMDHGLLKVVVPKGGDQHCCHRIQIA